MTKKTMNGKVLCYNTNAVIFKLEGIKEEIKTPMESCLVGKENLG